MSLVYKGRLRIVVMFLIMFYQPLPHVQAFSLLNSDVMLMSTVLLKLTSFWFDNYRELNTLTICTYNHDDEHSSQIPSNLRCSLDDDADIGSESATSQTGLLMFDTHREKNDIWLINADNIIIVGNEFLEQWMVDNLIDLNRPKEIEQSHTALNLTEDRQTQNIENNRQQLTKIKPGQLYILIKVNSDGYLSVWIYSFNEQQELELTILSLGMHILDDETKEFLSTLNQFSNVIITYRYNGDHFFDEEQENFHITLDDEVDSFEGDEKSFSVQRIIGRTFSGGNVESGIQSMNPPSNSRKTVRGRISTDHYGNKQKEPDEHEKQMEALKHELDKLFVVNVDGKKVVYEEFVPGGEFGATAPLPSQPKPSQPKDKLSPANSASNDERVAPSSVPKANSKSAKRNSKRNAIKRDGRARKRHGIEVRIEALWDEILSPGPTLIDNFEELVTLMLKRGDSEEKVAFKINDWHEFDEISDEGVLKLFKLLPSQQN